MRILIFCDSFLPRIGGLENHVKDIAEEMVKTGHEVKIITLNQKNVAKKETKDGIEIYRVSGVEIFGGRWTIPNFFALWHIARALPRSDVINSQTRFFLTSLFALIFAKINKIKYIHTEHGAVTPPLESWWKNFLAWGYDQTLGRVVLRFADGVISTSKPSVNFVKGFGQKNTFRVPSGIFTKKFIGKRENANPPQIFFLGRIVRAKGIFELAAALSKVKNKYKLVVAGDGYDMPEFKKSLAEKNINVEFLGFINRPRIKKELLQSAIVVNPSYAEGFPINVLEAMCAGCAIVATPVGGTPEMIGKDRGVLVSVHDIKKLQIAIDDLLANPKKCDEIGKRAQKFILENYDVKKVTEMTLKVFEKNIK